MPIFGVPLRTKSMGTVSDARANTRRHRTDHALCECCERGEHVRRAVSKRQKRDAGDIWGQLQDGHCRLQRWTEEFIRGVAKQEQPVQQQDG